MISLEKENFCDDCKHFEAEVDKLYAPSYAGDDDIYGTVIHCKQLDTCREIYKRMMKELKEKKK